MRPRERRQKSNREGRKREREREISRWNLGRSGAGLGWDVCALRTEKKDLVYDKNTAVWATFTKRKPATLRTEITRWGCRAVVREGCGEEMSVRHNGEQITEEEVYSANEGGAGWDGDKCRREVSTREQSEHRQYTTTYYFARRESRFQRVCEEQNIRHDTTTTTV